ncbi:MAG: hypothetical protein K2M31_09320, partial [Muribaculaceae bacterium]|nr:hypothetical protein [Muribaculaceae bacterium]
KLHYADLLDRYLQPLLPGLTSLLNPDKANNANLDRGPIEMRTKKNSSQPKAFSHPKPASRQSLRPLPKITRLILLTTDLYPYFGSKAPLLQSQISNS